MTAGTGLPSSCAAVVTPCSKSACFPAVIDVSPVARGDAATLHAVMISAVVICAPGAPNKIVAILCRAAGIFAKTSCQRARSSSAIFAARPAWTGSNFVIIFQASLKCVVVIPALKAQLAQRRRILRGFPVFIVSALGFADTRTNGRGEIVRAIIIGSADLRQSGPGSLPIGTQLRSGRAEVRAAGRCCFAYRHWLRAPKLSRK